MIAVPLPIKTPLYLWEPSHFIHNWAGFLPNLAKNWRIH